MFPMSSRQQNILHLGYWATSAIGKAFINIHPFFEFQYYYNRPPVVAGTNKSKKLPVKMVDGVFPKGILTINFFNGYHIDGNDHDALTHCAVTTPNTFIKQMLKNKYKNQDEDDVEEKIEEKLIGGTFALGSNVFNYSDANFNFVFSGATVSHTTGVPYNVPDMPGALTGKKSYKSVMQDEVIVKKFLKESVLAWAGFGASNANWLKTAGEKEYVKKGRN